jgi:hypothetical protein
VVDEQVTLVCVAVLSAISAAIVCLSPVRTLRVEG